MPTFGQGRATEHKVSLISSHDPGVPNWLDAQGQRHGTLFGRWQDAPQTLDAEYTPATVVVPLTDVARTLPGSTVLVTESQRRRQREDRTKLIRARYATTASVDAEIARRRAALEALMERPLTPLA